jgi:hypothetical protein
VNDILMYDGINSLAAGIARAFPDAVKVAGYVNGIYAWSQAEWDLFPHADHVTISVTASANAGDVLDVETGDATPAEAAAWIRMRKAAGLFRPTVYCSLSVIPDVRRETGSLVLGVDYDIWVADYDDSASNVYPLAVAKQYRSTAGWDASAVYDERWPHRKPPGTPVPPPPPAVAVWPAGVTLHPGMTGGAVRVLQHALSETGLRGVRGIAVDGVFGGQTETAVRNFQARYDLGVDGIAGPQVRAALGV